MQLVAIGVELRLEDDEPPLGVSVYESKRSREVEEEVPRVAAQSFVEVVDNDRRDKWHGSTGFYGLPSGDEDLTNGLLAIAHTERESNLGGILGDLRRGGHDITRWEFHSLPFRVELSPRLRALLSGGWRERDPRPADEAITLKLPRTWGTG